MTSIGLLLDRSHCLRCHDAFPPIKVLIITISFDKEGSSSKIFSFPHPACLSSGNRLGCLVGRCIFEDMLGVTVEVCSLIILALILGFRVVNLLYGKQVGKEIIFGRMGGIGLVMQGL